MSKRDERRIVRLALHDNLSAKEIKQVTKIDVTVRHIQRVLSGTENVSYIKRKITPSLTSKHKESRVEFAKKYALKKDIWTKVIFSDEKRFTLDGPDGYRFYWHHLQHEEETFSKRPFGGGGLMLWGAFCCQGKSKLFFARTQLTVRNTVAF